MVQGVGFRYHAQEKADHFGLAGYARNRADGSVEIEIEGREASVARMIDWLKVGPRWAVVESVRVTDVSPLGETEFEIIG